MQNSFRFEAFDVFFNQIKAFVHGAINPMKLNVKYFDNFFQIQYFSNLSPGPGHTCVCSMPSGAHQQPATQWAEDCQSIPAGIRPYL